MEQAEIIIGASTAAVQKAWAHGQTAALNLMLMTTEDLRLKLMLLTIWKELHHRPMLNCLRNTSLACKVLF